MTTPSPSDAAGIYAALSDTALFAAMAEAANRLTGELVHQADTAASDVQREQFLARLRQVRDERWSVDAGDRAAQLACIQQWEEERRRLQTGTG